MNISNFNLLNFRNNKEVSTYHSKEFFNSYSLKINSLDYTIAKIVALIVTAPFVIGAVTFIGAYDITSKSILLIKNKICHNKPKTIENSKMLKVALAAVFIASIAIGIYMYANTGVIEKPFRENFPENVKERFFKSSADRSAERCQSKGLLNAVQGALNPVIELPSSGDTTFERLVSNSSNPCQSEVASKVIQGRPSNSSLIMSRLSKAVVSLTNNRTETYQSIPSFTDMNLPSIFTTKGNVGLKPPYIMHYSAAAVVTAAKKAYKGLEYGFYGLKTAAIGAYDFSTYSIEALLCLSEKIPGGVISVAEAMRELSKLAKSIFKVLTPLLIMQFLDIRLVQR